MLFGHINSIFYKKHNLDKIWPYNGLEQDIYSLKTEATILLLGDFNAKITTNQSINLSNDSNPNLLWLNGELVLPSRYTRNFEYLVEICFGV